MVFLIILLVVILVVAFASIKIVKNHEEESLKLPKDVSRKNIMAYGEKLKRTMSDMKSF